MSESLRARVERLEKIERGREECLDEVLATCPTTCAELDSRLLGMGFSKAALRRAKTQLQREGKIRLVKRDNVWNWRVT